MFTRLLFAAFLAIPLVEIAVFVLVGQAVGLWPTLAGVVVTALAGATLIRWQGFQVIEDLRRTAAEGRLPGRQIADAMLIGLAGLLLLLPGYFSDLIGILLLVPPVRGLIYRQLKRRIVVTEMSDGPRSQPTIELGEDGWRQR